VREEGVKWIHSWSYRDGTPTAKDYRELVHN
jgi:hypothetical protein